MYGTLKPRRKDVPKELLSKKIDKCQMIAYQRGKVCVMKWMEKKAVCLISTIHNLEMVQVQSHKTEIRRKPKAVMEYNNTTIGGVDRLDQHLTNYPLIKKRGNKYYKNILSSIGHMFVE
ncbi:piggyBac transposable element-derived protein 4 [Trichonephila clavipes]|uniref:PiggyBac transposable element-derived protein 4 n=1 Tax=Trichonephila clavipes TaxID=2585209 RepID=A0A8X6RC31_TRICX|nr:piggyBac transposable element-derived protein 4 [Trichonephila clavipes]